MNIKHGRKKPHISGSSGKNLIPGITVGQNIHNCMIITINVYMLVSPRGSPNLQGHHNIQHLEVYHIITVKTLGNGNGVNKIVITTPQALQTSVKIYANVEGFNVIYGNSVIGLKESLEPE